MTAVLDSIRRIVAEDAAHAGTTHEVYLTKATQDEILKGLGAYGYTRFRPPTILGLPLRTITDPTRRDCIATIRRGQVISVTNL